MLGIKFLSDMKQITKNNYEQKIIEMKNLIKIWSIRTLTVLCLNLLLFQKYLTYQFHYLIHPNKPYNR